MLDTKRLRETPDSIARQLALRGFDFDAKHYQQLEEQRKLLQQRLESLQAKRNVSAKQVGECKRQGGDTTKLLQQVANLGEQLEQDKKILQSIQQQLQQVHVGLPNLAAQRTPIGKDENDNQEMLRWGEPKQYDFDIKDHVDLATARGWLDLQRSSQLAMSRFSLLKGDLARLHRALAQFMLDLHVNEFGYEEINLPLIVNEQTLFGTGQLPKFEQDLFRVQNGDKEVAEQRPLFLIPTAEVPLTNLVAEQIFDANELQQFPKKLVAHTPCFRSEAGNSGRDTRGLIRQHQFEKVELVNICLPEQSWDCLEAMSQQAEQVLQRLELPYRKIALCTGDMGFAAAFTYDLEVWLPSQHTYREISSLSNCLDFQARRMQARFKDVEGQRQYLHTLNGSGVAVGRALVAFLENHQQADGGVAIPEALRSYLGNRSRL